MPLVRISLMKGKVPDFGRQVGEIVYQTMMDRINVPPKDNFQIITEHDQGQLFMTPIPGYPAHRWGDFYSDYAQRRTHHRNEKGFYKTLAERLHQELNVRMEDVVINLVEVKKENWSFGNGIAQYAP